MPARRSPSPEPTDGDTGSLATGAVVALATLLGIQMLRALPALVAWELGADQRLPVPVLVIAGLGPFAVIAVLAVPLRRFAAGPWVASAGALVVVTRVGAQLSVDALRAALVVVGAAAFLGFLALLVLARAPGLAPALLAGLALDAAIRGATDTLDLLWLEDGWASLVVLGAAAPCAVLLVPMCRRLTLVGRSRRASLAMVALGPLLLLEVLVLVNQGWIAEVARVSSRTAMATAVVGALVGAVAAGLVASRRRRVPRSATVAAGVAILVVAGIAPLPVGPWFIAAVILAQASVGAVLHAIDAAADADAEASTTPALVAAAGGYVLMPVLGTAFYVHAFLHVPLPPAAATFAMGAAAAAACLALPSSAPPAPAPTSRRWLRPVALVGGVAVAVAVFAARPVGSSAAAAEGDCGHFPIAVATYNVRLGIAMEGDLNLQEVGDLLDASEAGVVALQETTRGMLLASGADMVGWLQDRLDMPHEVFHSPLGNPLYGTAIISRHPIVEVDRRVLPVTAESGVARSLLTAKIDVAGDDLLVMNTHLASAGGPEARVEQLAAITDVWDGRDDSLIVGDLNAARNSMAVSSLLEATGFQAAGAVTPAPDHTYPSWSPSQKLDWVFHTRDLVPVTYATPRTTASDHLPVFTTITRTPDGQRARCNGA